MTDVIVASGWSWALRCRELGAEEWDSPCSAVRRLEPGLAFLRLAEGVLEPVLVGPAVQGATLRPSVILAQDPGSLQVFRSTQPNPLSAEVEAEAAGRLRPAHP